MERGGGGETGGPGVGLKEGSRASSKWGCSRWLRWLWLRAGEAASH